LQPKLLSRSPKTDALAASNLSKVTETDLPKVSRLNRRSPRTDVKFILLPTVFFVLWSFENERILVGKIVEVSAWRPLQLWTLCEDVVVVVVLC